ncbi:MAG TPA: M48 family metallopeptidase [Lysobacter sp.]|nr:M48 family metallopeptidase [Lysobacter sp.]
MNFFERQAAARRASTWLVVLFVLAVLGIVGAVDAAVWLLTADPAGVAFATIGTLAVIALGSLYRIASLRAGGETVALELGGVAVPEDTREFHLRRLRNVVEEIAIASGVPVPRIFVLEHEAGINAFAAGYAPTDAVIAVTRGALDRLNRDELQGVIAHEFSHILNGDMRLNIRLIGVLFGILVLALIGRKILEHGRFGGGRNNKGAGAILLAALVAMVVGYVGLFFGRLIKAGVSRSRERLADASAVQFTRQTSGLVGALKKIGGLQAGSRLGDRGRTEEVSHMLFGDGLGLRGLFATHPPLHERIRALEPGFDPRELAALAAAWGTQPPDGLAEDAQLGLVGPLPPPLPPATGTIAVDAQRIAAHAAQPDGADYRHADALIAGMPDDLRAAAARDDSVVALLLALLADTDATLGERQRTQVAAHLGEATATEVRALAPAVAALHPALRLPLAALAFPVLRRRPRPELDAFLATVDAMIHADGEVSLFEYCLGALLGAQVRAYLDPAEHARIGRRKPGDVRREFATLLAVLAQAGSRDEAQARRAYLAGLARVLPQGHIDYAPPADGVRALDAVWEPLDRLDPLAKQVLVEALVDTIAHDGRVTVAEAELLRTVCGVLGCPLPPLLADGA